MESKIHTMIRNDLPDVLEIECESFDNPWSEYDFVSVLKQRGFVGLVARERGRVVGFVVYERSAQAVTLLNLAVSKDCRRRGIGAQFISVIAEKASLQGRKELKVIVRETNLAAQLFYRSQGFMAESVIRRFYEETDEDGYVMVCRLGVPVGERQSS